MHYVVLTMFGCKDYHKTSLVYSNRSSWQAWLHALGRTETLHLIILVSVWSILITMRMTTSQVERYVMKETIFRIITIVSELDGIHNLLIVLAKSDL